MAANLNDNHRRHLLVILEHVDKLLSDALSTLSGAEVASPFQQCIADSQPVQRKLLADHLSELRALMTQTLVRYEIPLPTPRISSLWLFRTALLTAQLAIEDLRPIHMREYGHLSDEETKDLEVLYAKIVEILNRMSRCATPVGRP